MVINGEQISILDEAIVAYFQSNVWARKSPVSVRAT
jgi:hypothetical protein